MAPVARSDWGGVPVLVTGAGGFIGSHLVEALVSAGADVRAFVRYNSRNDFGHLEDVAPSLLGEVDVFTGDLVNPEAVAAAVSDREVIFHLGALIPIPYSYRHPREFVEANVVATLNVLEAARRSDAVRRLVHTSTSEVYGTAQTVPIAETHPLHPQSPYAATKVGADQLALTFHLSFGTPAVVVRPFNTYGPRQSARAVIPTIISQALSRDHVELGALDTTRDLLFVADTVGGMLAAGSVEGIEGEVINLGTGKEIAIGELAERVLSLLDLTCQIVSTEERLRPQDSEVERLLADARKAKKLLGWKAEVDLDEGLGRVIEWTRSSLDRFKPEIYNV
jgi:NAD dependent epimerase/dehydratase